MMMKSLVVLLLLSRDIVARLSSITVIPKTFYASSPPIGLCKYGTLGALKSSLSVPQNYPTSRLLDKIKGFALVSLVSRAHLSANGKESVDEIDSRSSPRNLAALGLSNSLKEARNASVLDPSLKFVEKALVDFAHEAAVNSAAYLQPFVTPKEFQQSSGIMEIISKLTPINPMGGVVKSYANEAEKGAELSPEELLAADTRIKGFLQSRLVESITELVIQNITIQNGIVFSVSMMSPMQNIGQVLCAAASESAHTDETIDYTCALISMLSTGMACHDTRPQRVCDVGTGKKPIQCQKFNATAPVDMEIDPSKSSNETQGVMDFWLYESSHRLMEYANKIAGCSNYHELKLPDYFIPGWHTILMINAAEEGSSEIDRAVPLAVVLESSIESCRYVISFRGTMTDFDWAKDFASMAVPIAFSRTGKGLAHAGFYDLSRSVFPIVKDTLASQRHACPKFSVTIGGHSMGGALSQLMGAMLADAFPNDTISTVAFGAPHVFDADAAAFFEKNTKSRTYVAEMDAVPFLPCSTKYGLPRCDSRRCASIIGEGHDGYAPHVNVVEVPHAFLQRFGENLFGSDSFGTLKYSLLNRTLNWDNLRIPAPLHLSDAHTCGYSCFLDSLYCRSSAVSGTSCNLC